mmetsp:Transcript_34347/g.80947  ORF Transcript_34347/g.80947 Transcript_34347/m.80947 type:complete len:331 (-) Transcript_34347:280-1272(-)
MQSSVWCVDVVGVSSFPGNVQRSGLMGARLSDRIDRPFPLRCIRVCKQLVLEPRCDFWRGVCLHTTDTWFLGTDETVCTRKFPLVNNGKSGKRERDFPKSTSVFGDGFYIRFKFCRDRKKKFVKKRSDKRHSERSLPTRNRLGELHFVQETFRSFCKRVTTKFGSNHNLCRLDRHDGFGSHSSKGKGDVLDDEFSVLWGEFDVHARGDNADVVLSSASLFKWFHVLKNPCYYRNLDFLQKLGSLNVHRPIPQKELRNRHRATNNRRPVITELCKDQGRTQARQHRVHVRNRTGRDQISSQASDVSDLGRRKPAEHVVDRHEGSVECGVIL